MAKTKLSEEERKDLLGELFESLYAFSDPNLNVEQFKNDYEQNKTILMKLLDEYEQE